MKQPTDLNQLYYFVQIVRHNGFSAAGRALNIPKSRLSRHLNDLESHLGVRLIQRNTRHFHLTDIGKRYLSHCEAMLIEAEAAQNTIDSARAEPSGTLRISCPLLLLDLHVGCVLTEFMQQHSKINIELEASNRMVDVMAEGFDIAIRARSHLESSELVAKIFSQRQQILVAQTKWLQQKSAIEHPHDLHNLPSLGLGRPQQTCTWSFTDAQSQHITLTHQPRLLTTDMHTLLKGALQGLGVVQLPYLLVKPHLQDATLSHVLPNWQLPVDVIHAVYPSRRGQLPAVKLFLEALTTFYVNIEHEI